MKFGKFGLLAHCVLFIGVQFLEKLFLSPELNTIIDDSFIANHLSTIIMCIAYIGLVYLIERHQSLGVLYEPRSKNTEVVFRSENKLLYASFAGVINFFLHMGFCAITVISAAAISSEAALNLWDFQLQDEVWGVNTYLGLQSGVLKVVLFISVFAILMPAVEEIFFRGFLFSQLNKKVGLPISLLLSCLIFSLMHDQNQMLSTFSGGLLFCFLYIKFGSILVPAITHGLTNFFLWLYSSLGGTKYFTSKEVSDLTNLGSWHLELSFLTIGLIGFYFLCTKGDDLFGIK